MNTPPSFQAALKTAANRRPHDLAIGCGSKRVTWVQLDAASTRMARALRDKGVVAGDLVTIATGPIDVEELKSFVAARLAPHKRPRSYEFVTYPIRDAAGKVRRSQLRAERLSARKAALEDGN